MSEEHLFDRLMTKEQRLYIKCQHCDVGSDLVDAVDTLRSSNQGVFIPKRKTQLQKIGALFSCCKGRGHKSLT